MLWLFVLLMVVLFGGLIAWSVFEMERQTRQVAGVSADSAQVLLDFGSSVGTLLQRLRSSVIAGLIGFALFAVAIVVNVGRTEAVTPAWIAVIVYLGAVGMVLRTWWYPVVSTAMFLIVACAYLLVIVWSGEWNTWTIAGPLGILVTQLMMILTMLLVTITALGTLIGSGIAALRRRLGAVGHS